MRFAVVVVVGLMLSGCALSPPPAPMMALALPNPDLNSCGLRWSHDQGYLSVWRATRIASIGLGEFNSNGQFVETRIAMNPGDLVSIKMGIQRARCL